MLTFKHSGHSGDIIYSLASVKHICLKKNTKAIYYIKLNVESETKNHSMGKYMISQSTFDMLRPLLRSQPYIKDVLPYNNEKVDYDLDSFRDGSVNLSAFHIGLWNSFKYPELTPDLSKPWINVYPDNHGQRVCARSMRYTNPLKSYVPHIGKALFVGTDTEFKWATQFLNAEFEHRKCKDFLELAQVIKGATTFIGNQSLPFALAEAMKVNRILEVFQHAPNVIPIGTNYQLI